MLIESFSSPEPAQHSQGHGQVDSSEAIPGSRQETQQCPCYGSRQTLLSGFSCGSRTELCSRVTLGLSLWIANHSKACQAL